MLGCTDLKAWMALCWKTVWKVDPLPLSVPESFVPEEVPEEPLEEGFDDEPQAASKTAAAITGTPIATIRRVGRRRTGGTPLGACAAPSIDRLPSERCLTVSSLV
jgi:hypothetical protein